MFLEWFGDLDMSDKFVIIFSWTILIGFALIIFIYRIKYMWEREELNEYMKKCYYNKTFVNKNDDLEDKNK